MGSLQVINLECMICETAMNAVPAPNADCSEHCPRSDHAHARCDSCSPAGWLAIVAFKVGGVIMLSEPARRYLELLNEMELHRATKGLTRTEEIDFAGRLDRIWSKLVEDEQETIEQELRAMAEREVGRVVGIHKGCGGSVVYRKEPSAGYHACKKCNINSLLGKIELE